ncbi:MAG: pyridoxal phosphate-dependent aminotransferase [Planctomycetota bacterium]
MRLSPRAAGLSGSITLTLAARARALAAAGRDVVSMAVGEPDFDAPPLVRAAAHAAIDSGEVRYTPAAGLPALRAALAAMLTERRGVATTPDRVVVTHSGKHALSHALLALVEPGDEVLLLLPAWSSYDELVRFAGGVVRQVAPRADAGPDFAALHAALSPRTRGIVLNTPSNPSGYVWGEAELRELMRIARERDLWVISDEIYARLVYGAARHVSPASLDDDARDRVVIVDGASKAYAMTGYRMGFLAGPAHIAKAVGEMQSQVSGCPNFVSQQAYLAGLVNDPPEMEAMRQAFDARRVRLYTGLRALGLDLVEPLGAFYAFPDVARFTDERGVIGLCEDALEQEALALVPGTAFGMEGHVRLSYALAEDRIDEALRRFGRVLARGRATT